MYLLLVMFLWRTLTNKTIVARVISEKKIYNSAFPLEITDLVNSHCFAIALNSLTWFLYDLAPPVYSHFFTSPSFTIF